MQLLHISVQGTLLTVLMALVESCRCGLVEKYVDRPLVTFLIFSVDNVMKQMYS